MSDENFLGEESREGNEKEGTKISKLLAQERDEEKRGWVISRVFGAQAY